MRAIASAAKAAHFCASALVFLSLLVGFFPESFEPLLSQSASAVLARYAAVRDAGFEALGAMTAPAIAQLRHWAGLAGAAEAFGLGALAQDAVIFALVQIPTLFFAMSAARRIGAHIRAWKARRGLGGELPLYRRVTSWRALAADAAFLASLAGLFLYFVFAYGAGAAVFLALARLADFVLAAFA